MTRPRFVIVLCSVVVVCLIGVVTAVAFLTRPAGAGADPAPSESAPATSEPAPTTPGSARAPRSTGSEEFTLTSGGISRIYHVHTPPDLPAHAPLVVVLHGGGGSGTIVEQYQGWDAEADAAKFVVAYPDGLGPQTPAWNTDGGCCGYPARENVDDVRFITDMVSAIEARTSIDPSRIYAAGLSNGGMMAYTLACKTTLFAAIGAVSATELSSCDGADPTSVIHIHGLQDTKVRFDGGKGDGTANIDGPSVPDVIAQWRSTDDCAPATASTAGVVTTSTSTCADGRAVELITISDAGHGWPGSHRTTTRSPDGVLPSQAIDATDTIWQFFAAHPKP
ncbi:MAG: prolyl oligopeptidase family serine peptidase [Actinobacteria bacterium]|nr:prolyl oligopeptidase family serine peptidase [Actinomycetota bacterium]